MRFTDQTNRVVITDDGCASFLVSTLDNKTLATVSPYVEPVKSYVELRQAEYPPFTDYLDGVAKDDAAQIQAYKDACLAVKVKYPKV